MRGVDIIFQSSSSYSECLDDDKFSDTMFQDNFCKGGRGSHSEFNLDAQCRLRFPHLFGTQPCSGHVSVPTYSNVVLCPTNRKYKVLENNIENEANIFKAIHIFFYLICYF